MPTLHKSTHREEVMMMQQISNNFPDGPIDYRDFRHLMDGVDEISHSQSVQRIAAMANSVCSTLLPCDGGGIGIFDQNENRVTLWIPLDYDRDWPGLGHFGSHDDSALSAGFINHWVEMRQFLFLDMGRDTGTWQRYLAEAGYSDAHNMILDGVCKQDGSKVGFYLLANVDKTELPKYQIVMNLLLSSLLSSLLQLAGASVQQTERAGLLTEREQGIITHIQAGLCNKKIAKRLNISVNTVKSHIYNIFQKLNATNRVEALIKAKQAGYL